MVGALLAAALAAPWPAHRTEGRLLPPHATSLLGQVSHDATGTWSGVCFQGCTTVTVLSTPTMHGDPVFKVNGTGTHFWIVPGTLMPLMTWKAANGSVVRVLAGKTITNPETGHQWFSELAIMQQTPSSHSARQDVLVVKTRHGTQSIEAYGNHLTAAGEYTFSDKGTLTVSMKKDEVTGRGFDLELRVDDIKLRVFAREAAKFEDPADRIEFYHLNLDLLSAIPSSATGIFPELAGVREMSPATKALLKMPPALERSVTKFRAKTPEASKAFCKCPHGKELTHEEKLVRAYIVLTTAKDASDALLYADHKLVTALPDITKLAGPTQENDITCADQTSLMTAAEFLLGPLTLAQLGLEFAGDNDDACEADMGGDLGDTDRSEESEEDDGALEGDMIPEPAPTADLLLTTHMIPGSSRQLELWKALRSGTTVRPELRALHMSYNFSMGKPWTDRKMPYCFDPSTTQLIKDAVGLAANRIMAAVPGIEITEVDTDATGKCDTTGNSALIKGDGETFGCWSCVGEEIYEHGASSCRPDLPFLNLGPGCESLGIVMHELLHALGQGHEQSRSDRDQYVEMVYENIQDGMAHNFDISTTGSDTSQGYDIMSLMHYSSTAFSKDGSKTIKVTNEAKAYALYTDDPVEYSKYELGNRMGMTQTDANQLAKMYGLTAQTLEVGNCTDLPGEDGNAWSAGADYGHRGCKAFFDLLGDDCKFYGSPPMNTHCCKCEGGVTPREWKPPSAPTDTTPEQDGAEDEPPAEAEAAEASTAAPTEAPTQAAPSTVHHHPPTECECEDSWSVSTPQCEETQEGCPSASCDGDTGGPWCPLKASAAAGCVDARGLTVKQPWFYCS